MTFCFNQFPSGVGESALKAKKALTMNVEKKRDRWRKRMDADGNERVFSH